MQCCLNSRLNFFSVSRCFSSDISVFPSPQNLSFWREAKFHTHSQPGSNEARIGTKRTKPTTGNTLKILMMHEIHKESKNDEVRQVYVIWAVDYDKEISAAGAFFHKPLSECLDTAVNLVFLNLKKTQLKILDARAGTEHIGIELLKLRYTDAHVLDISQVMLNIAQTEKGVPYRRFICFSDRKKQFQCVHSLKLQNWTIIFQFD